MRLPHAMAMAIVLLLVPVVAGPAAAADCPQAGGQKHPFTTSDDVAAEDPDVLINGGGFGHGVGMSQFGAQGAASLGCTHTEILTTYFPTTRLQTLESRDVVRVHMHKTGAGKPVHVRTTTASAGGEDLPWVACAVDGTDCKTVATQPAGATWTVTARTDGTFEIRDPEAKPPEGETTAPPVWKGGELDTRLRMAHDGTVIRVVEAVPSGGHDARGMRVKWGFVEFDYTTQFDGTMFVTSHVTGEASGRSAMDTYVLGLDEVPLSWHLEAQAAQAVAGRSYAEATIRSREDLARREVAGYSYVPGSDVIQRGSICRCDILPTTSDQQWEGFQRESLDTSGRWNQAIASTHDRYVTYGDPAAQRVATTFYSSSHGDSSAAASDIWNPNFDPPYLQAVDTSAWEEATRSSNSLFRWTRGYTRAWLASRFGLDEFRSIQVVEREPGGRPAFDGVVVTGMVDGSEVQQTFGSEAIRTRLGAPSGLISVVDGDVPPRSDSGVDSEPTITEPPTATRLAGEDRIATAVELALDGWSQGTETVVIARADKPPDALAGSGMAGADDAPLLVTWSTGLADPVADAIQRLGASRAVLLGGEAALSSQVAADLKSLGVAVTRVAGANRADTAARIARRLQPSPGSTALIVRGSFPAHPERAWADALAVSGFAATHASEGTVWPILLADGTVPPETVSALEDLGVSKAVVVGGSATIPDEVMRELQDLGLEVRRVFGADRYGTSRAVAGLDTTTDQLLVAATAKDFPDGLAAGPYAARTGGMLLLVPSVVVDGGSPWRAGEHEAFIEALGWNNPALVAVGGQAAIDEEVVDRLEQALYDGARK